MKNKLKQFANNKFSQFGEDGIIKKSLMFCQSRKNIGVWNLALGMGNF
jgi:hypothetical protein